MDKEMRRLREYVQHFWHSYETPVQNCLIHSDMIFFLSQNKDDGKNDERAGVKKKGPYKNH